MNSRITRIRLLFSKQFESETSFRSNLRSSWLLGGPNWTEEVRTELRSELNCRPEDSNGGVGGDEESDEECDDNDSDDIEINI